MVKHLRLVLLQTNFAPHVTDGDIHAYKTCLLGNVNVHCNGCGGRGHRAKHCHSLKLVKDAMGKNPVFRHIHATLLRATENRYRGINNPQVVRHPRTLLRGAGHFKGRLFRDFVRTMTRDEKLVSGLLVAADAEADVLRQPIN